MRFLRKPTLYGRFTFRKTKVVELMNKNGGSNPSLSAKRDCFFKKGVVPFPLPLLELGRGYQRDLDGKHLRVLQSTVDINGKENIELVPIKSKAGYMAGYKDPEYISNLPAFQLPFMLKDRKYRTFQLEGDSMLPIPDKSYVIGEYVQNLRTLKDGQVYIIITIEGIVFKMVSNEVKKGKKLLLRSLNPAYKPYELDIEKVIEAWKFTTYFTSEIPDYYGELATIKSEFKSMSEKLERLSAS